MSTHDLLTQECEKRGLPVSLELLLRHIENNHQATYGAQRSNVEALRQQRNELYDALNALIERLGEIDGIDTTDPPQADAIRLLVGLKRARDLAREYA